MAANYRTTLPITGASRGPQAALILMIVPIVVGLLIFLVSYGALESYPFMFLVPWALALGVLMSVPLLILIYQRKFNFFNPLVFATWSYWVPAFVLGAIFLATGLSNPYYLTLIDDVEYNLPYTMILIGLGFIGLTVGYFLPFGRRLGSYVASFLPATEYRPSSFFIPGLILLGIGVLNTILAFWAGVFGYQLSAESNVYGGLIFASTFLRTQAIFLLVLTLFRQRTLNSMSIVIGAIVAVVSLAAILFAGSRGGIIQFFLTVFFAYMLSGRRVRLKQALIAGSALTIMMLVGMIYGTTFRSVKGSEEAQSGEEYADNILRTFDRIRTDDTAETLQVGFSSLTGRVDIVSAVAVVVANHEQLKPYEEAYGLDNNIWTDTTTFLIPRVLWKDKPYASDPRKFGDLYFNYGQSSFAITPVGDLLRNYGMPGVFFGMLIIGIIIRFLYRTLLEDQPIITWRATLYFMLITLLSYEGFYGTMIPILFRVAFMSIIGIVIVQFLAGRLDRTSERHAF
ncbi:MAG: hypothetical protein ABR530_00660 [Pyrinomonadaceae bacterium]